MKKHFKQNAGLTLIELVVAIAMATIVTAAATSVLLMGLRINRQTGDTASQQITVRSLLNVMEKAAADGNITAVDSDFVDETTQETQYGSWVLKGEGETVIFQYDAKEQVIYTNGTPVLENVIASNAIMEGQLLSISIETKDGTYTSSIYCRTYTPGAEDAIPDFDTGSNFIKILQSQYRSRGEIKGTNTYYSQWYCGGTYWDSWDANTPWCACYVSWALDQAGIPGPADYCPSGKHEGHANWFADVDEFIVYFQNAVGSSGWEESSAHGGTYAPQEGDLIFFDWDKGVDPEHVGVVLQVKNGLVYTIEGNSAGRVTIRTYPLTDPRIIGYGVLFAD